MADVEPAQDLSIDETVTALREATWDTAEALAALARTMEPSKSPGDTARAMYVLAPHIGRLAQAMTDWARMFDR